MSTKKKDCGLFIGNFVKTYKSILRELTSLQY